MGTNEDDAIVINKPGGNSSFSNLSLMLNVRFTNSFNHNFFTHELNF